ncbi:hypothetical protein, partial [Mycoplasmopsis pullorum]
DKYDKNFQSIVFQNSHIPEIDSVPFQHAVFRYFAYLKTLIQESENNLVDEIFEKLHDEIPNITNDSVDAYGFNWIDVSEKIKYLWDREYLRSYKQLHKLNLKELEEIANYHLVNDYLIEFSKRFEAEFTKELKLEQQNQMSM